MNLNDPDMGNEGNRRLRLRGSNFVRDDLDVPVMIVNSELEAIACFPVRQPDTDRLRWWESAGTCHVSEQGQGARSPKYVARLRRSDAGRAGHQPNPDGPALRRLDEAHARVDQRRPASPHTAQDRIRRRARRDRPRRRWHREGRHPPAAGRGADRHQQRDPRVADIFGILGGSSAPVRPRRPHRSVRRSSPVPREVRGRREAGRGEWGPARVDARALGDEAAASWDAVVGAG